MPLMQRQDPKLAEIITYLSTGDLPMSDKAARKILMIEDQFTLDDGVLWHFFAPKSRHAKRRLLPLRQLSVPLILKLDILKSFHEHGSSHKCEETLFETIRQKYFWFNLYSDTLLYCKQCKCCLMAKKRTHPNKRHCIAMNRAIFLIKFWRIFQDLFDVIV